MPIAATKTIYRSFNAFKKIFQRRQGKEVETGEVR